MPFADDRWDARRALLPAAVVAFSAAAGWFYSELFETGRPAVAIIHGLFLGVPLLAYERGYLLPGLRARIRRCATPVYAVASLATLATIFALGAAAAAGVLQTTGLGSGPFALALPRKLAYMTAIAALTVCVLRVRDLIGPGVFVSFLLGRYHRPIREDRLFLFIDLADSTRFAERHGELRASEYLGRAFEVLAGPVHRHRGVIDDYVGDLAIVSWPTDRGTRDANAIRCLWSFLDEIERDAPEWLSRFGEVPSFRAAMHCGPVVAAEIGLDRHKIAYFGDVMNTTSRLEGLAKTLGEAFVLSAELFDRLGPLPTGVVARDLGVHVLRGRREALGVVALDRSVTPAST